MYLYGPPYKPPDCYGPKGYGNLCTWKNWKRESDGAAIVLTQTDAKPPYLCQGDVTINGVPYGKFGMFDNITPNHRPGGVMEVTSVADWDLWSMEINHNIYQDRQCRCNNHL